MQRQPTQPPPSIAPVQDTFLAANASEAKYFPFFGPAFQGDYASLTEEELFDGMIAMLESAYETETRVLAQGLQQTQPMLMQVAAQGTPTEKLFVPSLERVYATTAERIEAEKKFLRTLIKSRDILFPQTEAGGLPRVASDDDEGEGSCDGGSDSEGTEEADPPGTENDTVGVPVDGVDQPE